LSNPDSIYELRQIKPGDKLTGLSAVEDRFVPLTTFLERKARAYQRQKLAQTYAAFNVAPRRRPRVVGYITLACGEIVIDCDEMACDPIQSYDSASYPAVQIVALAVDAGLRGCGIGRQLVEFSIGMIRIQVCSTVGCRFVSVKSSTASVEFYKKCGFTMLDTQTNREKTDPVMFLDLYKTQADG
jgi:GNAT superfamily N-acetyltransferase